MDEPSTGAKLIEDARAALASAEAAIARIERRLQPAEPASPREAPPGPPASPARHEQEANTARTRANEARAAILVRELTNLDSQALEELLGQAEALLTRYVIAATVYDRILREIRTELHDLGAVDDVDIDYRDADGRPGIRAGDVVRVMVAPQERISALVEAVLTAHADPTGLGVTASSPATEPPAAPPPAEHAPSSPQVEDAEDTEPQTGAVTAARPASREFTYVASLLDEQSRQIDELRQSLDRQAAIVAQVTHFLDYLTLLLSRNIGRLRSEE